VLHRSGRVTEKRLEIRYLCINDIVSGHGGPSGSGVCCGATIGVGSDGLGEIEIDAFCTAVAGADGIGTA